MILTGNKILQEVQNGNIKIYPFSEDNINPNSYNYRLGETILEYYKDSWIKQIIPDDGFILKKNKMYLASTYEKLGSQKYAMRLIGRSSVGRLGLFLQVSADLGHTKSSHSWTLELVACNDIKVYKYMKIGQISFWRNIGEVEEYKSHFNKYNKPQFNNKIHPL